MSALRPLLSAVILASILTACATEAPQYATSSNFREQFREIGCPAVTLWQPIDVGGMTGAGFGGCVVVDYYVGPDGTPGHFSVKESYPTALYDESVLEAIRNWKFDPGAKQRHVVQKFVFGAGATETFPDVLSDGLRCGPDANEPDPAWLACEEEGLLNDRR